MTALAMKQKGLKPATKIVLYWLADHHNGETGDCFPSLSRLAEVSEMSKRSVQMHIDELERVGLITITQRNRDNNSQTTNNYSLTLMEFQGEPQSHKESQGGVQNLLGGVAKFAMGGVQNLPAHNLVRYNLGKEPNIIGTFDDFFVLYPRKVGKGAARAAWAKAIKKADPVMILGRAAIYAQQVVGHDMKFVPHPATWLNQERWEDDTTSMPVDGADARFREMVNDLARLR